MTNGGPGPPLQLTPHDADLIVKAVEAGGTLKEAAAAVGVTDRTIRRWLEQGREDDAVEPFLSLAQRVATAWELGNAKLRAIVEEGAEGKIVLTETIESYDKDGNLIGKTVKERRGKTTADARWLLQRRDPEVYGDQAGKGVTVKTDGVSTTIEIHDGGAPHSFVDEKDPGEGGDGREEA